MEVQIPKPIALHSGILLTFLSTLATILLQFHLLVGCMQHIFMVFLSLVILLCFIFSSKWELLF